MVEATRIANMEMHQNESKKGKQVGADEDDPENNNDMALFNKKRKGGPMGASGGNRSFAKKR